MKVTNKYQTTGEITTLYINDIPYIIDTADLELVKQYHWRVVSVGYAGCVRRKGKSMTTLYLHRLIMGATERGQITDHIDGDVRNNRRSNLRFCRQQQNCWNRSQAKNNTSGRKGVYYRKDTNTWVASITVNKHTIYLGAYEQYDDAVKARENAEKQYYGEYRRVD